MNGQSPEVVVEVDLTAVSPFEWAPSVPVNRYEVGDNVVLYNGAGPLGTTLTLTSLLIKVQSLSQSKSLCGLIILQASLCLPFCARDCLVRKHTCVVHNTKSML